jgi:4-hydroxybenzoate polyprenyltransferase
MSRVRAYAQLVRLPNVFTAAADVSIGLLASRETNSRFTIVGLITSSACLYCAGMALNDYFDRAIDRKERPQRPIPSGAISQQAACGLAAALSVTALGLTLNIGSLAGLVAGILLALVLAYDAGLKSTLVGPLAMAGCRFLNVLLGFTANPQSLASWPTSWAPAAIVGTYVFGVTVFARDEVDMSQSGRLRVASGICAVAILFAALVRINETSMHLYLGAALALMLLVPAVDAINTPSPGKVQRFVKSAILGIVLLDSALATAIAGPVGLSVLFWLIPAVILGRWLYLT